MIGPVRRAFRALLLLAPAARGAEAWPAAGWAEPAPAVSAWSAEGLQRADTLADSLGSDALLVVHRSAYETAAMAAERPARGSHAELK